MTLLRHLLSILLLPVLAVVALPAWILSALALGDTRWSAAWPAAWLGRAAGLLLFVLGLLLLGWCIALFARVGRGTLAPWDPTHHLVAVGPYRRVRNPMIAGAALMLLGLALLWGSWKVGLWACAFTLLNHCYFVWFEEPGLEKRFGETYRRYKAGVPRWAPRLKPWSGE